MLDKAYNEKGDAAHYDTERINTIRSFEKIYGTLAVMYFCEINALKYRMRVGKKEGNSVDQELVKAEWYEKAAAYYFNKLIHKEDQVETGIDELSIHAEGMMSCTPVRHNLPWE